MVRYKKIYIPEEKQVAMTELLQSEGYMIATKNGDECFVDFHNADTEMLKCMLQQMRNDCGKEFFNELINVIIEVTENESKN